MSDVDVVYSNERLPSIFDVKHKEVIDNEGNDLRWVLETQRMNMEKKKRFGQYVSVLNEDIDVPEAEVRKKGEPWRIKNGPETYILMKRSKEVSEEKQKARKLKSERAIRQMNSNNIPGSSFRLAAHSGPLGEKVETISRQRTGF